MGAKKKKVTLMLHNASNDKWIKKKRANNLNSILFLFTFFFFFELLFTNGTNDFAGRSLECILLRQNSNTMTLSMHGIFFSFQEKNTPGERK